MVYKKHQQGFWETRNELSDRLSKDMNKRGFKYLGSVTVYSHLQACGIINDHACNCYKYEKRSFILNCFRFVSTLPFPADFLDGFRPKNLWEQDPGMPDYRSRIPEFL